MYLEEIENDIDFENDKLECKSILDRNDIIGWLKTIAGFSNANGGTFYIGVEDKTNKLIGFDKKSVDIERNYFNNKVNEHLIPRPSLKVLFLKYEINNTIRYVIKISVNESPIKPVVLKYKGFPAIFMRRDGFTNGATYEEIIDMSIKSKKTQYDVLISDIKYNSDDFSNLFKFYEKYNNGSTLNEKSLKSLGFINEDGYLSNGAVLFKDDYFGEKTEVLCSVFSGTNKGSDRIISINRYNGNITSTIEYMINFINQRMNHSIIKLDNSRINIDAYPTRSLFEGIINAIAHRDYYLDGTQIEIDMYKDRLEITSPGRFYKGDKIEKTYNLSNIISKRRNEVISGVLVICNVMEAAGTGFEKITQDYLSADDSHKPYIYSTSDHFTLVLPDLTYQDGIKNGITPMLDFIPRENGTNFDEKVLSFCYYNAHKISEITEYLGISDSTYFRKNVIESLEKDGYLIKDKVKRSHYYKTNRENVFIQ